MLLNSLALPRHQSNNQLFLLSFDQNLLHFQHLQFQMASLERIRAKNLHHKPVIFARFHNVELKVFNNQLGLI